MNRAIDASNTAGNAFARRRDFVEESPVENGNAIKHIRFGWVIAILLGSGFGGAMAWGAADKRVGAPTLVTSAPTAVTVLPQGAWVTRQMSVDLPAEGGESIEIYGLPLGLDRAGVQLVSAQAELVAPIQWQPQITEQTPAWAALEQQKEALDHRADKAADALQTNQIRLQIFQAQMTAPERVVGQKSSVPGEFLTDSAARTRFDRLLKTLIDDQRLAQNEWDDVLAARAELDKKFAQLKSQPAMQSAVLTLSRRQAGTTPVHLTLRYWVQDAQWRPLYRADLRWAPATVQHDETSSAIDAAQIHWSMVAEVSQHTGEDWSGVPLTLALQDTRRYVPAPHLSRWIIGFTPPVPVHRLEMQPQAQKAMAAPANDSLMALTNDSGFQAEFHSKQPVTVQTQSQSATGSITIPLMQQTVAAVPDILVAPPTQTQAVLTARFTPELSDALPPGEWQLFVEGSQVAQVHRPALLPNDKIRLSFGTDPKVQVKYSAAPDQREENGLIGKSTQMQRAFTVELTSQHARAVPVTVLMQLPVAVDAEISVEPLNAATPPSTKQFDGTDGVWAWSNQLKPQQNLTIQFGYRLRWPSDKTVYGLR